MRPVIVPKCVHFTERIVMRKVDYLFRHKSNIILVHEQVDLLMVIHDEERLRHALYYIILDAIRIGLEGHHAA